MNKENDLLKDIGGLEAIGHTWLEAIIHSSDDAIISKDLNGIVSSWNEGAHRIFGYTEEEMIGQPILKLIPEDRWDEELVILERLKRGERVDHFETKRLTKDGTLLDISLSISPIRDKKGRVVGASKIARNITVQKEAERMIAEGRERFQKELEATVQERTRELAELNMRLSRSNYELEKFAYIASHDLQEPLRKIHVFSERLEEGLQQGVEPAILNGYLQKMKSVSARMSRLIKDVLEYSRLSRGGSSVALVDLNEIIRGVLIEFDLWIAEKNAVISLDVLPSISGSAAQVSQLFSNLIGNSLKFCPGQPYISVKVSNAAEEELPHLLQSKKNICFVRIDVQDNGIGFEAEHADRIFNIFQRLNSHDTYSGSGIGLALCKKIVESHGGAITATGEPGKGATFHVYLPV
ncbi:MAG: PAS domain S-box protein [Chitinophagaceae bacterium]|nr:PAS domain S-box protein [Chitinophagaceae bacterium]